MSIFGREPAVWIGLIVTIVLNVVQTLAGQGFISDATAGRITDIANGGSTLALALLPLITALLVRPAVTSVSQPKLPVGTQVLVDNVPGTPKDTPPPDAVVAVKAAGTTIESKQAPAPQP